MKTEKQIEEIQENICSTIEGSYDMMSNIIQPLSEYIKNF